MLKTTWIILIVFYLVPYTFANQVLHGDSIQNQKLRNDNACNDTLYFLNGDKKPVIYVKQSRKKIFFKGCGKFNNTQSISQRNIHKIIFSNGSEQIIHERVTDKKYRGRGDNRVWNTIGVILGIPVGATGLILLGFLIFPQW